MSVPERLEEERKIGNARNVSAFTLVELLVVIAIISVLAGLLLPALEDAIDTARAIACMNNIRQIGTGLSMYTGDYADRLPGPTSTHNVQRSASVYGYWGPAMGCSWTVGLGGCIRGDYFGGLSILFCPAAEGTRLWRQVGTYQQHLVPTGTNDSVLTFAYANSLDPFMPVDGTSTSRFTCYSYRPTVDSHPDAAGGGITNTICAPLSRQPPEKPIGADYLDGYDWHDGVWNLLFPDGHAATQVNGELLTYVIATPRVDQRGKWDYLYDD